MVLILNFKILDACSGVSTDWALGVAHISYSYVVEVRSTDMYFLAPPSHILPTGEETWAGLNVLLTELLKQIHGGSVTGNGHNTADTVNEHTTTTNAVNEYITTNNNEHNFGSTQNGNLLLLLLLLLLIPAIIIIVLLVVLVKKRKITLGTPTVSYRRLFS